MGTTSVLKRLLVLSFILTLASSVAAPASVAASPPGTWFQGFEKNTNGWYPGSDRNIVRVPSGYVSSTGYASGIPSAAGNYHARLDMPGCTMDCDGSLTWAGGYSSVFPPGAYPTQPHSYLEAASATTNTNDPLRKHYG